MSQEAFRGLMFMVSVTGVGVAFAAGFAVTCKLLKWAPVNITVNVITTAAKDEGSPS